MNESWIKETMELIEDLGKQHTEIESTLEELLNEKERLENQIDAAESLIRIYRNKHQTLPTSLQDIRFGHFGDKSYSQILKEIASILGGYFKVGDATEIMLQAGVNKNRRVIQSNIYAVLYRDKEHFIKIKEGEYRYTNGTSKPIVKPSERHTRSHSGIQKAIKELKDKNPQLTKKEVLNRLLETNFDFKGKKPASAVNIVWAKLGYHKEGKQQVLEIKVPESLTRKILGK
jgi:hypothetical protein